MTYAGVQDPQERADLIAWLRKAGSTPTECPSTAAF
jgi:cytochrome c2